MAFPQAALGSEALPDGPEPLEDGALLDMLDLRPDVLAAELGIDTLGELDQLSEELLAGITGLSDGSETLSEGLALVADDGLAELIDQLDEDDREGQRDLALLRELDGRTSFVGHDASDGDVTVHLRHRLASGPGDGVCSAALLIGPLHRQRGRRHVPGVVDLAGFARARGALSLRRASGSRRGHLQACTSSGVRYGSSDPDGRRAAA